ncbi:uncharacterized protein LOC129573681 [Sitodiplosis mosellana]|uniref:uncharacterized protein LOC129573681 n=1 Tax=Sitodiplosis mosellana TaxID=263140 RepID=UPI0024445390|nr:uncharacterized protein LOC129573681 [Sitodiplosis mosellana]
MLLANHLALTFTFAMVIAHWTEPPIPNYLHICEKLDQNLTECLKTSIDKLRSVLIEGIPNVDIPSLDPLEIDNLFKFDRSHHGLHIKAENVLVLGILKFNIDKLDVVKHGKQYDVDVVFPRLQVEGACDVSGQVKEFLVDEACSFVETFHNSSAKVKAHFSHVANGWLVQTDKIDVKIKASKGVVKLYDLSKGRRILDRYEIDNVINHNFNKMNKELFPVVEKVLQHQLKEMSNKVFGNFSYGQIFPISF